MRIPLLFSKENCEEWVLIELQGSFVVHQEGTLQGNIDRIQQHSVLAGLDIGDLLVNFDQGCADLRVANYLLHGKIETLKKPFAVLKKQSTRESPSETTLLVVGVARKRILFNSRL
eukprot:jgi/Galph1/108/GphlegSOOS_G4806.1